MRPLLDSQQRGFDKLRQYKVGALFMEAGTGKTQTTHALLNSVDGLEYVIWLTPFQTKQNLRNELDRCGGFLIPVDVVGIETLSSSDRIYLELLSNLDRYKCAAVVCDESLKIKNFSSKRTNRIIELGKKAEYRLILNGTPLTKNILDLWAQMEFLSPKILGMGLTQYKNTFCKYTTITKRMGSYKQQREFVTGYANIDYLYSLIRHYVYEAALTLDVSQDYTTCNYNLDEEVKEEYERIKEHFLSMDALDAWNNNIFMAMTQKLQHAYCCTSGKFDAVDRLLMDIPEERTIIFCRYIDSCKACEARYTKARVLSYQKESLGLNLQDYYHTIYFDKVWDLALRIQSGRRTFRTGQQHNCHYYDLTGNVGLERLIDSNIEKKVSMAEYFKAKTKEQIKDEL